MTWTVTYLRAGFVPYDEPRAVVLSRHSTRKDARDARWRLIHYAGAHPKPLKVDWLP